MEADGLSATVDERPAAVEQPATAIIPHTDAAMA
jgi:hypothetical protein